MPTFHFIAFIYFNMNNMFLTIMALGCVSSVSFALRVTEKIPMRDGVVSAGVALTTQ